MPIVTAVITSASVGIVVNVILVVVIYILAVETVEISPMSLQLLVSYISVTFCAWPHVINK
jgi:hypothetical protein